MRVPPALAALLAPAAAVALLLTVPGTPEPDRPASSATTEPVTSTLAACPVAPAAEGSVVRLTYGLAPTGRSSATGSGALADLRVGAVGGTPEPAAPARGRLVRSEVAPADGLVAHGAGDAARGLFAGRQDRDGNGGGTLAATVCAEARGEWWFAGAGAGIDHASELFLSNVDEGPAVVDVRVLGATGNVDVAGTRGLTLAPGKSLRLPLAEIAPGSEEVTVEVDATRGRVVAAVSDQVRGRNGATGREWLPAATAPSDEVHLAGVPGTAGRRVLLVTNPGEQQALVSLEVLGPDGVFVPLGKEQVSVAPDSIESLDLTEEIGDQPAAVRLVSDVDVTATLRSTTGGDHATAAAVDALSGPAVVTTAGDRSFLQLSGGDGPSTATVTAYTAAGNRVAARDLAVPPAGLVEWPAPAEAAYAVLVPRTGALFVGVVHRGPGIAAEPAQILSLTLTRPVVRPLGQFSGR